MKITPEQIARVAEIKEGLAVESGLAFQRELIRQSEIPLTGATYHLRRDIEAIDPHAWEAICYAVADSLLRTVFKDVPVGGELLQTGRAPEDTAYQWQHDACSVTIGQVLEGK